MHGLLDALTSKGQADLIADFASPAPAIVTAEMLGVPVEDHEQLKEWSTDFAEMLGNFQHNPDRFPRVLRSVEEMCSYFRSAMAEQRLHPRGGLVSAMMEAEVDGARLSEDEIIANLIITMSAAGDDHQPDWPGLLLTLLRNRMRWSVWRGLVADPLPSRNCCAMRVEPAHCAPAPTDVEMGGKKIRERQAVIAVMGAANRDPERFPDPDRLDLARQDNRHLAFGWAAHFCFGAALARLEGQIAFETILRRLPGLTLDTSIPLEWRHNLGLRGLTGLPITFTVT